MKQVYQKGATHKFNTKKDQNNYFRAEISQRYGKLLTLKQKSRLTFNNAQFFFFFFKNSNLLKVNLLTQLRLRRSCQLFLILTL